MFKIVEVRTKIPVLICQMFIINKEVRIHPLKIFNISKVGERIEIGVYFF
jgi:hypothetical protein